MLIKKLRVVLILSLISFAPLIYSYIHSYLTSIIAINLVGLLKVNLMSILAFVLFISNCISAIITAIVTAFPCGYLVKSHSKILSLILVLITLCIPLYSTLSEYLISSSKLIIVDLFGQCIAVTFSMIIFSEFGCRVAQKSQKNFQRV